MVQRAVEMKKTGQKKAKAEKDDNLRFDFVWCVFDIDDHPGIADAKQQARDNEIELAISNPCFELWILLHFQDHRKHVRREVLRSLVRKHLPDYVKDVPCDKLRPLYDQALSRASKLETWHLEQSSEEHRNPSTGVHKLTEQIRRLGNRRE